MIKVKPSNPSIHFFLEVLIALTLIFIAITMMFNVPADDILLVAITGITFLVFLFRYGFHNKKLEIGILAYILLLNAYSSYILETKLPITKGFFWALTALLLAYMLNRNELSIITIGAPFLVVSSLVFIGLAKNYSVDGTGYIFSVNRNVFPMIVFTYGLLLDLTMQHKGKKRTPLILPAIILSISYLSHSRVALIVGLLYLLFALIQNITYFTNHHHLLNSNKKKRILFVTLAVLLGLFIGLAYYLTSRSRVKSDGVIDGTRLQIYLSYFQELSLKKLLLGFQTSLIAEGVYAHMHNSFIQLLMSTGIFSLPFWITYLVIELKLLRHNYYLFALSLLPVIYAMVENYMFFWIGDVFLIPLLYVAAHMKKQETR